MSQAYLLMRLALEALGPQGDLAVAHMLKQAMELLWDRMSPEERSALVTITRLPPGLFSGV